jgi:hypothetical protein
MRSGTVLASLAALVTLSGCDRHREDAEIVSAAIDHLSKRLAAEPSSDSGILLLRSQTQGWTEQSLKGFSQDSQSDCPIPEELYRALVESAAEIPVIELLNESKEWQIAPAEVEARVPSLPPEEIDGIPVKAMVGVSLPGVSRSSSEALVILSFTWSVHEALARIRLVPSETGWQVKCAQLNYYV